MSSLLQSVLSAKLAGTSLDEDGRANANANANNEDWEEVNTSDEELVAIATAPGTGTATPLNISRPTSPGTGTSSGPGTKLKSSPLLGNERPVKVKAPKSKTDPLRSLPKEASQRIFLSLSIYELLSLSLVCKRYRKSATLNYCWYRKCLAEFDAEDAAVTSGGNSSAAGAGAGARWTRRESRTDWKKEYFRRRNQDRKDALRTNSSAPGSGTATPSRSQRLADSGIKTTRDMREEQWKEEATQQEEGYTKNEMRSYYKEAGGSKGGKAKGVKASRGKGGSRGVDEGLWE